MNDYGSVDADVIEIAEFLEALSEPHPRDIVDEWKPRPDAKTIELERQDPEYRWVRTDKIVGTHKTNIDRLVPKRLVRIFGIISEGDFDPKRSPPQLDRIDDEYYVNNDGIHRTIAHKHLDIEYMWAKIVPYS